MLRYNIYMSYLLRFTVFQYQLPPKWDSKSKSRRIKKVFILVFLLFLLIRSLLFSNKNISISLDRCFSVLISNEKPVSSNYSPSSETFDYSKRQENGVDKSQGHQALVKRVSHLRLVQDMKCQTVGKDPYYGQWSLRYTIKPETRVLDHLLL